MRLIKCHGSELYMEFQEPTSRAPGHWVIGDDSSTLPGQEFGECTVIARIYNARLAVNVARELGIESEYLTSMEAVLDASEKLAQSNQKNP